jgi:uncharacterized protein
MADLTIVDNDRDRYELHAADGTVLGYLEYERREEFTVLPHTEVDRSLRGQGWGDALARHALDDLRERGERAYVVCPFLGRWLDKHPEYEDLRHQP